MLDIEKNKLKNDEELVEQAQASLRSMTMSKRLYSAPWWLLIMVSGWIYVVIQMNSDPDYRDAFSKISEGIPLTLWLAITSYLFAVMIGLFVGIVRAYPPEAPSMRLPFRLQAQRVFYVIFYNLVSVYVEFMRGIPSLVFLLIAGFIILPAFRQPVIDFLTVTWQPFYNSFIAPVLNAILNHTVQVDFGFEPLTSLVNTALAGIFKPYEAITQIEWRGRDPATAIAGLSLIYGAFLSEVFRAGIQSVPRGQIEAAQSLGMTYFQTMRLIVIPQAVRNVLPPLGSDFIAMIKDTSLVTILGTTEITQLARQWSGSKFTYIPTYAVLSVVYLTMTVTGSLLVQQMERHLRRFAKR